MTAQSPYGSQPTPGQGGHPQPGPTPQGPAGFAQQGPGFAQAAPGPAPQGRPAGEAGFLRSLFDLKFENFVTIRFASVIYVIAIVLAVLSYIGTVLTAISMGAAGSFISSYGYSSGIGAGGVLLIIAAILLGWIPSLIQIIFTRVIIEFVVANVRTAQNTQKLVQRG
ncbi:DUF4282 domain-containing protein [Brevibacterium sp.]|uniref:DUF4282 domain-containing protein n=1 Tax=Brevibacterium sp. TaxID=1701 RepID=UPI0025C329EC|nr:DUF4282 domain-containing protein [Brevibacterium sp.]